MENEIMNSVEEVMENEMPTVVSGTGVGMVIGACLVAAGYGAVKLAKKGIDWYKAKKEAKATLVIDNTTDESGETEN